MKNFKLSRNLSFFAGLCFLISTIIYIFNNELILLPVLNGITCILMFINAYNNHKKYIEDKVKNNKD